MAVTWFVCGGILVWVGVKASQGTLPKNNWVGIRTLSLLASEEAWTTGHKAAAGVLTASGIPLIIGGIACLFLDDSMIGWVSIPVVVVLVVLVMLAAKKAEAAVQ
ncbi:SdpI family protein [Corynebacterium meitnerae]|uniref:SdpI family protein n=1 Tax=Corynebacterium meitnerae TaxID=2913498 RepID=UPI0022BA5E6A|nr:SdpI family protein [Corynebacterium meitnerae]